MTSAPHSPSSPGRLEIIDALRGIAALAVCWFHFTQCIPEFLPDGFVKDSGTYGFLGVQIFFVISGFIIPYTLQRTGYKLRDYGRFILKRIIRLDPPYFASLILIIAVGYVLMHFTRSYAGRSPVQSLPQLLGHIGYINAIVGYEWLSPIYWTLAIEFQYYLLLGLLFPLIASPRPAVRLSTCVALAALPLVLKSPDLVFWYLPWFLFGICVFHFHTRRIALVEFAVCLGTLVAASGFLYGAASTAALLATALLITWGRFRVGAVFTFLGAVSYSVYLTHVPVGRTLISLSKHFHPGYVTKLLILVLALAATLVASWLMYRFIEKPALAYASRLRYSGRAPGPAAMEKLPLPDAPPVS